MAGGKDANAVGAAEAEVEILVAPRVANNLVHDACSMARYTAIHASLVSDILSHTFQSLG